MEQAEDYQRFVEIMSDQYKRLNGIYRIKDENGVEVPFRMNWAQEELYSEMWYQNLILKARQLGFTTFVCLFMLDVALFNSNIECGIIAHNREDVSKIFANKIKFPYDHLPEPLKISIPSTSDNRNEIVFSNGSSIRVGTSMRSGTLQYLLISEFGKICAKYPEKAKEIVTGTLNTVHQGNFVFIESTAEGKGGYFFDYCESAQNNVKAKKHLTQLDHKFHFYPWWRHPAYTISDHDNVVITSEEKAYFDEVESKTGYKFTEGQKAWYVKKKETQKDEMKREFPSTPEEAFEAAIEGAYFKSEFTNIRKQGRLTRVPVQPNIPVDTWWDLGFGDDMSIWFTQDVGKAVHVVDFYTNSGEGLAFYKKELDKREYLYGRHTAPHDIINGEIGTGKTRLKTAAEMGLRFDIAQRPAQKSDGIQAVRNILPICYFDEERCSKGISALENYRKEWDDVNACWKDKPVHDWTSHPTDAFQTLGLKHKFVELRKQEDKRQAGIYRGPSGWMGA
jgi:hypothetical protein